MKQWKVGIWTTGLSFVALGMILLFSISGSIQWNVLKYLWPIIIIGFGLEIILTRVFNADSRMRFSGFSIFFLIVVGVGSLVSFSLPNYSLSPSYLVSVNGHIPVGDSVKRVEVQIYDGSVTVDGVDSNAADYTGELRIFGSSQSDADQNLNREWKVESDGNTLRFIQQKPEDKFSLSLFPINMKQAHLDLKLPKALASNVQTSNGSVEVSHMMAPSDAETSNGSITFTSIQGNVIGRTSNGHCDATSVQGTAELHSSNGHIQAQDIASELTADTSNGSVDVTSAVHGNWNLSTSNGHIDVQVPTGSNCKITGDTSNGSMKGNVNWQFTSDDHDHATSTLGSGTYNIDMNTSNGSVEADQK